MDDKKIFNTTPTSPADVPVPPAQNPIATPVSPTSSPSRPIASMPSSSGSLLKKLAIGLVAVLVVVVLIILFLPKSGSKKVNLVWWGLWEDPRVMQVVIADFEKANPNITVTYTKED